MALLVTDAIVLHAVNYLESSRILRLATREAGVQSVVARGARSSRKRFGSALDLFAEGQAQIQTKPGRDLHTLISFDVSRSWGALATDMGRFSAASALTECVLRVVHEEAAASVYERIVTSFSDIAQSSPPNTVSAALGALWRLVSDVGFTPSLDRCAECHGSIELELDSAFSHRAGGSVCSACASRSLGGRRLPSAARLALSCWLRGDHHVVADADARAHQRLLREFLTEHLMDGREMRAFLSWESGSISGV